MTRFPNENRKSLQFFISLVLNGKSKRSQGELKNDFIIKNK